MERLWTRCNSILLIPIGEEKGWLVYLRTVDGQTPYPIYLVNPGGLQGSTANLTTKFNEKPSNKWNSCPWGRPFTASGSGRGKQVLADMLNKTSNNYFKNVINHYWGQAALDTVLEKPIAPRADRRRCS